MAYIDKYPLDRPAIIALMERGNHEEIMLYLSKHADLGATAQDILVRRNNRDELRSCLLGDEGRKKGSSIFNPLSEALFIRQGHSDDVKTYIQYHSPLCCEAEKALMQRGDDDMIQAYIVSRELCNEALELFVECASPEAMMIYLKKGYQWYSAEAEVALIARGNHDEIMAHINHQHFTPIAEIALFERGNQEEFKAYYHQFRLYSETERRFLQTACAADVEDFMTKHPLSDYNAEILLKRINLSEAEAAGCFK